MASSSDPGDGDARDNSVARTAGLVVFSGIVISILKALNPFNKNTTTPQTLQSAQLPSQPQQPIVFKALQSSDPVSIDEIKEANGIKGDTIYAGRKLIIP